MDKTAPGAGSWMDVREPHRPAVDEVTRGHDRDCNAGEEPDISK